MEKVFEKVALRGIFEMKVYKSGKLIEEYSDNNLIVNVAKNQMAHLVAGDVAGRHITKIAFGVSNTDPDPTDSVITGQWSKSILGFSFPEIGRVKFDWILDVTENNGMAIREFGLLSANGELFARKTRVNPLNKEPDISVEGHWIIIF
jgi:hypothetical protein